MRRRNAPVMVIALLLIGLALYQAAAVNNTSQASTASSTSNQAEMARNKPVPSFTLQGLDGQTYQVRGIEG